MDWNEIRIKLDLNLPLYIQLANQIRMCISSGKLCPGGFPGGVMAYHLTR